ncbi:MAG: patatin-like phospholipase family protein [Candidatus Marinimicrobia bacterium]|nr:patatin-like phospholipase family protein [Candidatus Neomarinimicrobiota bacterium]MBT6217942.1 patatin-like phospholipase family protein [Candidatus Neomarinimicrobiota bacterium]MBT7831677.1 patatin-like phospholipase family protein [Candidatus Neomarinimicrobiota bacterium]
MNSKLGLVLSGGGAKGAYQVGVLQYMAEIDLNVDAVSGTSIGALNGAVISAERSLVKGANALLSIWTELSVCSPMKFQELQLNGFISVPEIFMLLLPGAQLVAPLVALSKLPQYSGIGEDIRAWFDSDYKSSEEYKIKLEEGNKGWLSSTPSLDILNKYASKDKLVKGIEFYVGLYESRGVFADFTEYVKGNYLRIKDTKESQFWRVQDLPLNIVHEAILASAALPMFFDGRVIKGKVYRDGGVGGAAIQSGNTPARPLVDSGCTHIVVTHLNDGSFWNRHDFPGVDFIEVRPRKSISNSITDLMAFKPEAIEKWIDQGYHDAKRCIGNVRNAKILVEANNTVQSTIDDQIIHLDEDGFDVNG